MTREEQAKYIAEKLMENPEFRKAFVGAITNAVNEAVKVIKSLQQEPCEDAISKQAVIEVLNKMDRYVADELTLCDTERKFPQNEVFIVDDVYEEIVEQLPPVKPTEKIGYWISNAEDDLKISEYTCSNCKGLSDEDSDFCPKCGSYNGGAK